MQLRASFDNPLAVSGGFEALFKRSSSGTSALWSAHLLHAADISYCQGILQIDWRPSRNDFFRPSMRLSSRLERQPPLDSSIVLKRPSHQRFHSRLSNAHGHFIVVDCLNNEIHGPYGLAVHLLWRRTLLLCRVIYCGHVSSLSSCRSRLIRIL